VNNEIGVIQDIAAIGAVCREKGIIFHVDAAQATGRVEFDLSKLPVDLMSLTCPQDLWPQGHWRPVCAPQAPHAPGSADAWWWPRARHAQRHLPTHQIVGMGEAYRIAKKRWRRKRAHSGLHDRMLAGLKGH
jgi:cysteine desulfurase